MSAGRSPVSPSSSARTCPWRSTAASTRSASAVAASRPRARAVSATTAATGSAGHIGTLWPVNDAAATDVARETYASLTADAADGPRTELAAHALHGAVRTLRSRYPASPSLWAAHIHLGA